VSVSSRLSQVFQQSIIINIDDQSRFIIFSDCHRGDNSWSDEFANNQNIYFHALNHYFDRGYTYIEAGDGEEMWENRNFEDIRSAHDNIYWRLSEFYRNDRLILLWGNHNREWYSDGSVKQHLHRYYDEREQTEKDLFQGVSVHEGIRLYHRETDTTFFITHGHQGDLLNDRLWWVGRFFVRRFWKPFQMFGFRDPTRPAKNFKKRENLEDKIVEWTMRNKQPIIVGHTHRPRFPDKDSKYYFNTGCCVHPRCITGLEITDGAISLVKWLVDVHTGADSSLFINKVVLEGPLIIEPLSQKLGWK